MIKKNHSKTLWHFKSLHWAGCQGDISVRWVEQKRNRSFKTAFIQVLEEECDCRQASAGKHGISGTRLPHGAGSSDHKLSIFLSPFSNRVSVRERSPTAKKQKHLDLTIVLFQSVGVKFTLGLERHTEITIRYDSRFFVSVAILSRFFSNFFSC